MTLEISTAGWVALSLMAACILVLAFVGFVWLTALARLAGKLMELLQDQSRMICAMKDREGYTSYATQQPGVQAPEKPTEERTAY